MFRFRPDRDAAKSRPEVGRTPVSQPRPADCTALTASEVDSEIAPAYLAWRLDQRETRG